MEILSALTLASCFTSAKTVGSLSTIVKTEYLTAVDSSSFPKTLTLGEGMIMHAFSHCF